MRVTATVGAMNGSLWVAVLGVVLACLSLGWQAATYVLTGGRVKVTLLLGAMGNGGMVTGSPDKLKHGWFDRVAEQGYRSPVVAVKVANVGRQPVTVAQWSVVCPLAGSVTPVGNSIGPALPHRLEVGESATWAVDMHNVHTFMEATRKVLAEGRRVVAFGQVELGDGRTKRSAETMR